MSSPFDNESLSLLSKLNLDFIKVPSGEIDNYPFLKELGKLKKKVILSTGMSNLSEIGNAISILCRYGTKRKDISILHCHTEYPSSPDNLNLNAIISLKNKFKLRVGLSDHSNNINASSLAVALGAKIIEKHITLNKRMAGPDHRASANPNEFKEMVKLIRLTEKMLGNGKKIPTHIEVKIKFLLENRW